MAKRLPVTDELPKEEAERRAREVARRMLNTPRKPAEPEKPKSKPAEPEKPKGKPAATAKTRRKPS